MLNFTVGPVQSSDSVRKVGGEQVPYFRTTEFSKLMFDNEHLIKKFSRASNDSKVVFMTGSGTASMEAAIMNTLTKEDKVIAINGGSFGQRFVDLLKLYEIPYEEIKLETGKALTSDILSKFGSQGFTALLVNAHETSTGVHYDLGMISSFCESNNLFLVVDAISSFLADDLNMAELGIDVLITGSQKALACPPGISILVLSPEAIQRIKRNEPKCMYLDLRSALINQERGQTPFTPAVGILLQINVRLREIEKKGGVEAEIKRTAYLAEYFRNHIKDMPFEFVSESMSNAVTSLYCTTASAYEIFTVLKDEYSIWVCPNGGDLRDKIFRVGHIGHLSIEDYDVLLNAFSDMQKRGLI